ncbi:cell division protein SepF [Natranaerobius trueperi]|uniref:Cell division protein SepF n=1 Tax=Natranaerobius trueperi TaxID=759412 RepID=A0A226C0M3_9FIRM|nr:cell division protein SepF [Natranaerobius trueperi]OWZ84144.1 cell division protein SepF [Natranaerobius trueperi]
MSFFEKMLVFLGLAEETEEEIIEEEETEPVRETSERNKKKKVARKNKDNQVVPLHKASNQHNIKVFLLAPKKYDEAQMVGKYLKNGFPVIVNLENLEVETAKQLIDFVSGTVFALDGNLHKIGQNIFLFSPPNIEIEGEISSINSEYELEQKYNEE